MAFKYKKGKNKWRKRKMNSLEALLLLGIFVVQIICLISINFPVKRK